ncbi:signal peptidase I [Senegalia massiliensis]|uniref:signal peptidase I n=1 Tax=Senegalia massiliensis TaxID=1720316 RepID=UPI00103187F2|nr:signal peptidase I [Senegalia massiliensis]
MSEDKSDKFKNEAFEWIKSILFAVVIAIIIKTFIFNTTYVLGNSMYPTLHEKDRLFTNKIIYIVDEPKRGDIVVLHAPDEMNKDYIKRVIGVEGDIVQIKNGYVYLNGEKLNEKYIAPNSYTNEELKIEVGKDEVFVLGDNRLKNASKDSRYFGTVNIDEITGKAFFRYYPFNDRFGTLK